MFPRKLLVEAARGPRTVLALLDRMSSLFTAEESSEEGRAFDIGYVGMSLPRRPVPRLRNSADVRL